ncbi:MAG: protein-export chaperone SecB [Bacteroidales bacterium]|nr:protein-export chaperone SecB [Bacteroidales bacterium]
MKSQKNSQGSEPTCCLIKQFLEHLTFETPLVFQPNSDFRTEIKPSVSSASHEDGRYHLVKVEMNISIMTDTNTPVFRLSMVYSAVVAVGGERITDEELHKILHLDVPQQLLSYIRNVVWRITRETDFPLMLNDDTFGQLVNGDENGYDNKNGSEDYSLSFHTVISEMNSFDEGAEFLKNYSRALKTDILGFSSFEQLPTFQTYYRFISPIPYHYPEIDGCDPNLWPMLFRLLFGNPKAKCELINSKKGLPELKFCYKKYCDYQVSELDFADLSDLLFDLLTDALIEVSVKLLFRSTKASESELEWSVGQLITKEQFFRLHNFVPYTATEEDREFFEMLYARIKGCDIQTYLYRL